MATNMESPGDYLDSPVEGDDVAYPCKGCGDILEEGKAFELAGNRWHLDCFRCNTCETLLDSDANLLLLGDGSLICNNCTYSCSACGNKIEDLAILTGDQAFCATCFRCRNCKRKIENLRYARTSQGIFCMSCHESLMARRRKKSRVAAANKMKEKEQTMLVDKSLPALPPNEIPRSAFAPPDSDTPGTNDTDTPTELSPRPRTNYQDSSSRSSSRRPRSPDRSGEAREGLLPSTTYRNHRHSQLSQPSDANTDGDFFIPLALDPSPAPNNVVTPKSVAESYNETRSNGKADKDYFGISKPSSRGQVNQSPASHIAFQEKGRQLSSDFTESPSETTSPRKGNMHPIMLSKDDTRVQHANKDTVGGQSPSEQFRLQEVPKSKKSSRSDSQSDIGSPTSALSAPPRSAQRSESRRSLMPAAELADSRPSMDSAISSSQKSELNNGVKSPITRKEVPTNIIKSSMDLSSSENSSVSSASSTENSGIPPTVNGKSISGPLVQSPTSDELVPPSRALARPAPPQQKLSDSYMAPRAPPAPPSASESDDKLPRWSAGGDFTMDEDMARILGGTDEGSQSILRRVSNAVRHGRNSSEQSVRAGGAHSRSMSETTRTAVSPKSWQKNPENGQPRDISSPISVSSPPPGGDPALLRRQLRNSEQRVAELERQIGTDGDIQNLNKKLIEKRKTVSVLDSQAEIIIRQIETLAGYVEKAKTSKGKVDFAELEESAIKDFVEKLEKLKQTLSVGIEKLYEEQNALVEEKAAVMADRDRALMEFEQLSSKNAQLAEMNNDLTHQIQERFKAQSGSLESPRPPQNGLGIYTHHSKDRSNHSVHLDEATLRPATGTTTLIGSTGYPQQMDQDGPMGEPATVLAAPHVINIRKGQAKKFNWKKGGQSVAKGVTKGFKGAFGAVNAQNQWQGQPGDSIGVPYNMTTAPSEFPSTANSQNNLPRSVSNDPRQGGGFGLFGKKPGQQVPKSQSNGNILAAAGAEHASVLFGSDLVERADHERRQIPSVVTRCIEEVELRGMDIEGIYRKTGGTGQVNLIKEGFEKTEDYDISDPDLDITAVTSVLKQYFRKLPTPLLTFDVYDRVLESTFVEEVEERCIHLRQTFNSLPPKHRDCLEFLIFHLVRVASREKENLMTPKNLAVVFAPTIMRDTSLEREMTDMHAKNVAVQFVIENSNEIFGGA